MKPATLANKIQSTVQSISTNWKNPDHQSKGYLFEDYIVTLFDKESKRFRLLEWRSDKIASNGIYPVSSLLPDLEFAFCGRQNQSRFAIECKWRKEFVNGKIDWAKIHQIDTYLDYQKKNNIPVFIAIGVGGEPSLPEKLFVTPLINISEFPEVLESQLIVYKRNPRHRFFYDAKQLQLF